MQALVVLIHSGPLQPLWQQPGLTQVGPAIQSALQHGELSVERILGAVGGIDPGRPGVLLHYSDPFVLRARPLRGLRQWQGPRLLACGDLHHGNSPIETLAAYLEAEPHDAVLLTFNPALVAQVRQPLRVPVRSLPPSFFRYPAAVPVAQPRPQLLHVGSLGPPRHATTSSPEEAEALYARHALVLNVPLNHDLNHRFFEVMAAGRAGAVELGAGAMLLWPALKKPEIRLRRHQMWRCAARKNRCTMTV